MKIFYFVAIFLLLTYSVSATEPESPLAGLVNLAIDTMKNTNQQTAGPSTDAAEPKGDCMSLAMDLLMFLYGELQNILNGKVVPDQMYLMVQGFQAMTKFNSAKAACLPQ